MKTLTLVRHAKSDWGHEGLNDIDRPLNQRGYTDAYAVSAWYKEHHSLPDHIISSTATRALSTALLFCRTLNHNEKAIQLAPSIYECSDKQLIDFIAMLDDAYNHIMIFGHNSSFTNVANELTNDLFFENIPTCGMVTFQFTITTWVEILTTKGKLLFYQYPKEFKQD